MRTLLLAATCLSFALAAPGEAQALADSRYASFRAGRASPDQLIAGARQLAPNPDSYASKAGMDTLEILANAGMLSPAARPATAA